jgi:small acid-soluble spore protein (thioredoxin-like protein)
MLVYKFYYKRRGEIMRNKPDDRRDNVDRIQYNIDKTIQNCELADEMIAETDDGNMKQTLEEKNKRRESALSNMREEIKDEAVDKRNGYK